MITAHALTKTFKTDKKKPPFTAVDNLNLDIKEGEVFGILGPNGAGKTTTVRMLTSLIGISSGTAVVNGFQVGKQDQQIRQSVGILTETPGMYERLSAEKNLSIYANLYGVADVKGTVEKYLRMLGLWDRRMDEAGGFSKGMRQKLAIARALLHEPKLLFLDEPTSGLDPEASHLVRDFIEELKASGRTIVLCTHNLDEADRLCDRIAIFKTRLIALDTPENLRKRLYGRRVAFHLARVEDKYKKMIADFSFVKNVQQMDNSLLVGLDHPEEENPIILRKLVEAGADIQFVGELRHSLEDIYLRMIHAEEE
ncbi:MAG: multidrug ABC transporter ATP-binding protein [Anaerolinea sp.]|nr:multidrug ABC transporter ATP-binding protein [Anaerolinea sp.]